MRCYAVGKAIFVLEERAIAPAEKKFYVYTLSYPDTGVVFYVGTGTVRAVKGLREGIDDPEAEAKQGVKSAKCAIIRDIWARGLQVQKAKQPVEKVFYKAHQQRGTHCVSTIEEAELISIKKDHFPKTRRRTSRKRLQKEAQSASVGKGRRPQPRFLSNRLRFCPAAVRKASMLTRQSNRNRKRRMPCQS